MGIKHFFIWMKKNHPLCLKDINIDYEDFETEKIEIDNLCIDMNGVIHYCAQKVYQYGNFSRNKNLLRKQHTRNGLKWQLKFFHGDNGNHVICDSKMYHLTRKLGKSLQEKSETLLTEVINEVEEKYTDLIYQHTQNNETIEVEYYKEKLVDLKKLYMDYKDNVTKLAGGDLGNVIQKFSKLMSMKLPKYKMIENT